MNVLLISLLICAIQAEIPHSFGNYLDPVTVSDSQFFFDKGGLPKRLTPAAVKYLLGYNRLNFIKPSVTVLKPVLQPRPFKPIFHQPEVPFIVTSPDRVKPVMISQPSVMPIKLGLNHYYLVQTSVKPMLPIQNSLLNYVKSQVLPLNTAFPASILQYPQVNQIPHQTTTLTPVIQPPQAQPDYHSTAAAYQQLLLQMLSSIQLGGKAPTPQENVHYDYSNLEQQRPSGVTSNLGYIRPGQTDLQIPQHFPNHGYVKTSYDADAATYSQSQSHQNVFVPSNDLETPFY